MGSEWSWRGAGLRREAMNSDRALAVFENYKIRGVYDGASETWCFSVVDIVAALIQQPDYQTARKYWNKLKERLKKEGSQTVTNCHQLKLLAEDGKMRLTDVTDPDTLLRIIQSVPSPSKVPPVTTREALQGLPTPAVRPDIYDDEVEIEGLANHFAMRHSKSVMDKIAAIPPGTGPMSYRRLHPTKPANTLFSGHRAPPAHFEEPRSITVREATRLQGFPDTFRVYGTFAKQMEQVTNIRVTTMSPLISAGCGKYRLKSRRTPVRADITGYQSWRTSGLTNAC